MDNNIELIMLGTGNAAVTKCYNTCFALKYHNEYMLVDAGGGNGILVQLEKAGISLKNIHTLFLTHAHTDHLLGAIWIIRAIAQLKQKQAYDGTLTIYAHDKVIHVIDWICRNTLPAKIVAHIGHTIQLSEVKDGDQFEALSSHFTCFDIFSTKEKQFGFTSTLVNGQTLTCLGDEPYNERTESYVRNSNWLMAEAFCLYRDRDQFKPYEKHHSTALDAGKTAQELSIDNLILFHTEDKTIETRKETYIAEATEFFKGNVYVPEDLESIIIKA